MDSRINKNICNVIASGSLGNCEIYFNSLAVDMGIPFSMIEPYVNDLQLVTISHRHHDHMNLATIKRLSDERPSLRFCAAEYLADELSFVRNLDILDLNRWYDYGPFRICLGHLYHDTPNVFYRLEKDGYKIFRATDSCHLEGITAKDYSLFCIESNYNNETIDAEIQAIEARGEYAYMKGVMNSHLSEQQADDFIYQNRAEHSEILRLHE